MSAVSWTALAFTLMILAGGRWRDCRRRNALNQSLHEIRRPLQALVLLSPAGRGPLPAGGPRVSMAEPVLQAMSAVGDLDRELNGGPAAAKRSETIAARLMADGCVRRWQSRAALVGGRIELSWSGPDVLLRGDGVALAAALENLIVNAIEHGGPEVSVSGCVIGRRVRIEVSDNGVDGRPAGRLRTPAGKRGRGNHGHGLAVAERAVSEHGGRLDTAFDSGGSRVAIVLPRATRSPGSSSAVRVNW